VKVLEAATLFAGPLAATFLGDFGADVTKIEHPSRPDAAPDARRSKDGVGLWFKTLGRNKRLATLDLSRGRDVFLDLVRSHDVLVENFRPGTLERWGLGPDVLLEANPRLVIARVTAFGQVGPWSGRPGFGSLAEAMSGFAAVTGEPDGPPTLPAVRARGRDHGAGNGVRGAGRAARPGSVRGRSGDRPGDHRADL
jgi:crotonobetainyl-CoA:carnitine CoA-transferase CaiB-like acyl-CoA transferase